MTEKKVQYGPYPITCILIKKNASCLLGPRDVYIFTDILSGLLRCRLRLRGTDDEKLRYRTASTGMFAAPRRLLPSKRVSNDYFIAHLKKAAVMMPPVTHVCPQVFWWYFPATLRGLEEACSCA